MRMRGLVVRRGGVLLLVLALAAMPSCSKRLLNAGGVCQAIGNYVTDRGTDMLDLVDVGLTFSSKPQVSLYANGVSLGGAGFGMLEGHFAGIGGGNVGWGPIYTANMGAMVWCYEELAFGDFDKYDQNTLNTQCTGIGGLLTGPWDRPGWEPS